MFDHLDASKDILVALRPSKSSLVPSSTPTIIRTEHKVGDPPYKIPLSRCQAALDCAAHFASKRSHSALRHAVSKS